jgi:hypothetical protein
MADTDTIKGDGKMEDEALCLRPCEYPIGKET